MIKSNFVKIIFLLILGILCIYPQVSYAADNCTEDQKKIMENGVKTAMENAVKVLTQYAQEFNRTAEAYINKCQMPAEKQDFIEALSTDAATVARANGVNYNDEQIWKYTGYNWQQEVPPAGKPECKGLLEAAQKARDSLIQKKNETEVAINRARVIKERDTCYCSAENMESINLCFANAQKELARDESSCKRFADYQNEFGGKCMLCPLFEVILKTIASVSSVAWNAVHEPLAKIVGIIFLILLALEVLKTVASPAGSKIGTFAKRILGLGAKVAITILLLSDAHYIYGYFLSPVLEGGLEMGLAIANSTSSGANSATAMTRHTGITSDTFSPKLYDTVISTVENFGKSAAMMPAVGRGLTCNAWKDTNYGIPNLSMWFSGAIMYVLGVIIWLAISFYLIDCTVQIGMLSGLVPLLVACWPFKLTESYAFKGCKMLMNSFFTYAMVGIVLLIGMAITTYAVGGGNMTQLQLAIDNSDIETLRELCDFGSVQILILIACALIAVKLIGQTGSLADQFSKGASSDIGTKLGGVAASAVTNAAVSSAKSGGKIVGTFGKLASDELGITAGVNKAGDKIAGTWRKGWAKLGRAAKLGKFQNKQIGSGLEGKEGGAEGNTKPEDKDKEKQKDKKNPEGGDDINQ